MPSLQISASGTRSPCANLAGADEVDGRGWSAGRRHSEDEGGGDEELPEHTVSFLSTRGSVPALTLTGAQEGPSVTDAAGPFRPLELRLPKCSACRIT